MLQKTWNNTVYNIPQSGERGWANLTNFLTSLADSAQTTGKQLIGRRNATVTPVTVTATTDCYVGVNIAGDVGVVNLPAGVNGQVFIISDESNAASTFNITINPAGANTIDGAVSFTLNQNKQTVYLIFNSGNWVVVHNGVPTAPIFGVTDSAKIDFTLASGVLSATIVTESLDNADISPTAAIAYSKLDLAASIVDADIATTISYIKLNLVDSIVDADINAAAAISYSKLALTNSIVNADINSAAAIAYSKLNLTASIVAADIDGPLPAGTIDLTNSIVNADVNTAAAIAYSKLALTGSIADADLSASGTVVLRNATQTLTNKTLSGAVVSDYEQFTNTTVPATPATGSTRIYASSVDKKFHYVDDAGTDTVIGAGGGGGGKNYLSAYSDFDTNPATGMVTNLTATGNRATNTTVWGANTTALLSQTATSLRGLKSAQIVNGSSASNFVESPLFVLDPIDVNTNQLFISFDMNAPGVSGDWLVQVIRYDASGTFVENISPSITILPTGYYNFKCAFSHSVTATDQYAIRFRSGTATARTLTIDTLVVGPQAVVDSAAVGAWISYAPTFSAGFGTTTGASVFYRRVGDSIEISGFVLGGTPAASLASFSLPTGLTINPALIPIVSTTPNPGSMVGTFNPYQTASNSGFIVTATNTSASQVYFGGNIVNASNCTPQNGSTILGVGAFINFQLKVPIAQWTSTVTLAGNANIEYASNSSASDADDTTSFVNGATGSVGILRTTAMTAARRKRVQFQTPIQPTDRVQLEWFNPTTTTWSPQNAIYQTSTNIAAPNATGLSSASGLGTGAAISVVSTTQVDVVFNRFVLLQTDNNGIDWSSASFASGARWRVAKYSAVGLAELAPATPTSAGSLTAGAIPGVTTNSTAGAGYVGEVISSYVTNQAIATSYTSRTSITLTPGDWDVYCNVTYSGAGQGFMAFNVLSTASTSTGALPGQNAMFSNINTGSGVGGGSLNVAPIQISTSTTYYVNTAGASAEANCTSIYVCARRRR